MDPKTTVKFYQDVASTLATWLGYGLGEQILKLADIDPIEAVKEGVRANSMQLGLQYSQELWNKLQEMDPNPNHSLFRAKLK